MLKRWIAQELRRGNPWIPTLVLAFGLFGMAWQEVVRVPEEAAFRERGAETTGQIVGLRKARRWRTTSPGSRTFIVTTTYSSSDGAVHQFDDEVTRRTFSRLAIGDPVTVRYVVGGADQARLTIREHRLSPAQNFTLFAWISGGAAIWLVFSLFLSKARQRA